MYTEKERVTIGNMTPPKGKGHGVHIKGVSRRDDGGNRSPIIYLINFRGQIVTPENFFGGPGTGLREMYM